MRRILTEMIYPAIPPRQFDWYAVREGYEPGDLIGRGQTEQEAKDDLLAQEADIDADEPDQEGRTALDDMMDDPRHGQGDILRSPRL